MGSIGGNLREAASVAISTNTTLTIQHHNRVLDVTAGVGGAITITVPAAGSLPEGFHCIVRRNSSSVNNVVLATGVSKALTISGEGVVLIAGASAWFYYAIGETASADMLSSIATAAVSHTGAGTPTIAAWNVAGGSAEYTLTLPTAVGNTGKFIGIRALAQTFPVLVAPYSGETVYSAQMGSSTYGYYLCGSNSVVLVSDGTSWRMVQESRGIGVCTINFTSAESATTINARIAALPKFISTYLILQFADGTYTLDAAITIDGFGPGSVNVYGNMTESYSVLHTNQAVILDSSASDVNTLSITNCNTVNVYNTRCNVNTTTAARMGMYLANCFHNVRGCYVLGTSAAKGFGIVGSGQAGTFYYNYVSTVQYGIYAFGNDFLYSYGNDDTGTQPQYGSLASAAFIFEGSTTPSGSVADKLRSNGGTFVPLTESEITLADVTTLNVSTTKHGFTPKAPNDATKFLDGTAAWDTVKDADLSTSDVTTNNVDSTKHGFTPKTPNDAEKVLDGTAAWSYGRVSPIVCPAVSTYYSSVVGTWTLAFAYTNTSNANSDEIAFAVRVPTGTYTLRVTYLQQTGGGKFDSYVDASNKGNTDSYGSALGYQSWVAFTSIAMGGSHTIKFKLNGKNASSTGYALGLYGFMLEKTA